MPARPASSRSVARSHGFTLLEIIIAIAVILILMGMVIVGMQYLGASSKEKSTRVTLANLQGMLTELETTAGFSKIHGDLDGDGKPEGRVIAPGSVVAGTEGETDGRDSEAIQETRAVMTVLRSIPSNRRAMDQLPPQQLFVFSGGIGDQNTPVMLDAWNNPIVFVFPPDLFQGTDQNAWGDRYGLWGLRVADRVDGSDNSIPHRILNPGGIEDATKAPDSTTLYPEPDNFQKLRFFRPFWVSAGPDGDFSTHDDNLYSFEN